MTGNRFYKSGKFLQFAGSGMDDNRGGFAEVRDGGRCSASKRSSLGSDFDRRVSRRGFADSDRDPDQHEVWTDAAAVDSSGWFTRDLLPVCVVGGARNLVAICFAWSVGGRGRDADLSRADAIAAGAFRLRDRAWAEVVGRGWWWFSRGTEKFWLGRRSQRVVEEAPQYFREGGIRPAV